MTSKQRRNPAAPEDGLRHHVDRVEHSGGPDSGHVVYRCDCGFASPYAEIDEKYAALAALTHLNHALAGAELVDPRDEWPVDHEHGE